MTAQTTETPGAIIHRRALVACCVLAVLTVIVTAVVVWTDSGTNYAPEASPAELVELRFEDEAEGVVAVFNADTGVRLIEYGLDEGVFVRSVMRGVARQRRLRGLGPEAPVELSRQADGQIWLNDPASGVQIYLGAFGPDNVGAFEEILEREAQTLSAQLGGTES